MNSIIKLQTVPSSPSNEPNTPQTIQSIGKLKSDQDKAGEDKAILSERRTQDREKLTAVPNQSHGNQIDKQELQNQKSQRLDDQNQKVNHDELSQQIHVDNQQSHRSKLSYSSNHTNKSFDNPNKDATNSRDQIKKSPDLTDPAQNDKAPTINETDIQRQDGDLNDLKAYPQDEMTGAPHDEHHLQQDEAATEEEDEQA